MENCSISTRVNTLLGLASDQKNILLYHPFHVDTSSDGTNFTCQTKPFTVLDNKKKPIDLKTASDFRFSQQDNKYFLTYKQKVKRKTWSYLAVSEDLFNWRKKGRVDNIKETGVLVPNYQHQGRYVLYYADTTIHVAYSLNLSKWQQGGVVLKQRQGFYNTSPLKVANILNTKEGILLLYFLKSGSDKDERHFLKAALFNKNNPEKLLQEYPDPLWQSPLDWTGKKVFPLGVVEKNDQLISYWLTSPNLLTAVFHSLFPRLPEKKISFPAHILNKLRHNPLLKPIIDNFWESKAVFNPAALYADDKVHLVYRAIGNENISVLGYAQSADGIHIDRRLSEPIFIPPEVLRNSFPANIYSPFASGGGGYGGAEDPRLTKIGNTIYMTYVAYDGASPPRVALTSIKVKDFLSHNWSWQTPVLISPPGVVDKNACIMPEKVNGKYVIFHRVFPNILIDFVDSLDFDGGSFLKGEYQIKPRPNYWDSRKLGAGPPPLKTKDGWLLIYQAVDDRNDRQYKIGAMLLDLNDPTKVLHRTSRPLLEPTAWYENVGHKAGVAYPCGAVTIGKKLMLYYGGADTVVCAATANLDEFIGHLKSTEKAEFTKVTPVFTN